MRIISSFSDYYDCIQANGQDQSVIYIRESTTEDIERKQRPLEPLFPVVAHQNFLSVGHCWIGFCGTLYPAIDISLWRNGMKLHDARCFTLQDVDEFVDAHCSNKDKREYRVARKSRILRYRKAPRQAFEQFFQEMEERKTNYQQYFNDIPTFLARPTAWNTTRITYNACLRDFEFYRVIPPFQAFQEIEMFLNNIARPQKPMPAIPDKVMAEAKGFDKFSFRKDPKKDR